MHVDISKHTFSKGNVFFSDQDNEFMASLLKANREQDTVEEEAWSPEYEEDDKKQEEPVSREELAQVVSALVALAASMKQPAPNVTVELAPNISIQPHKEIKTVHRDAQNRISSIESEIK